MFDRRNNLSQAVADDVRACLGAAVFETVVPRNVRLVRSAEPRPAGADLRPQMPRLRGLYAPRARADRAPAAAGGGGMSAERPAQGPRHGPAGAARRSGAAGAGSGGRRRAARAAACARSRSRGSGPTPTSRASSSTRRRSTSSPNSIRERGVLQPILLRPDGEDYHDRRRRAALARGAAGAAPRDSRDRPRDRRIDHRRAGADREYPAPGPQPARGGRGLSPADPAPRPYPGRCRPDRPQVAQPRRQPVEIARSSRVRAAIAIARRYQHGPCAGRRDAPRSRRS